MAVLKWKTDFLVNTSTAGNQLRPSVTALRDGGFAIAWYDEGIGGSPASSIHWQRFDALGQPVGGEHIAAGIGNQDRPDLVQLADGSLWIAQEDQDPNAVDITGQVFSLDGVKLRSQNPLDGQPDELEGVALASLGSLGSVAVFTNTSQNGSDVMLRYFDANGVAGALVQVNSANPIVQPAKQAGPAVAVSPTSSTVAVVWSDDAFNAGDIRCRIFNAFGAELVPEFTVNSTTADRQFIPTVVWLDAARFVVTWTSHDSEGYDTYYKIFNSNGSVNRAESLAHSVDSDFQGDSDIAALPDGGFAICFSDGTDTTLQVFNNDGSKRGAAIMVNTVTTSYQIEPSIAALSDGRLIVTWRDSSLQGGDASQEGVRAQIIDPRQGQMNGGIASDTLYGHDTEPDTINGLGGSDVLFGLGGGDEIFGGINNDTLCGGEDGDLLDGGDGSDTADYRSSVTGQVSVSLLNDTASGGDAQGDLLDFIENLMGSLTRRDILIGDNSTNRIRGFGGNDSLRGEGGDDFLDGGDGADALNGGAGTSDWALYGDSSSGTVNVNLLLATASGGQAQGDSLVFIENLEGSHVLRDILIGNDIANLLFGYGGNDSLRGEGGNDLLLGGDGADSLNGGAGIDTAYYLSSASGVTVDLNLVTQSSGGDANGDVLNFLENIVGSGFDDVLSGSAIANSIDASSGADTLNGRQGSDRLTGGSGGDTFRFDVSALGVDTITDWQDGLDKISIGALVETTFAGLTFQDQGTTRVIIKGLNGTGAIVVESSVAFSLDAGDFMFV